MTLTTDAIRAVIRRTADVLDGEAARLILVSGEPVLSDRERLDILMVCGQLQNRADHLRRIASKGEVSG